jgi:hypothetical protein
MDSFADLGACLPKTPCQASSLPNKRKLYILLAIIIGYFKPFKKVIDYG